MRVEEGEREGGYCERESDNEDEGNPTTSHHTLTHYTTHQRERPYFANSRIFPIPGLLRHSNAILHTRQVCSHTHRQIYAHLFISECVPTWTCMHALIQLITLLTLIHHTRIHVHTCIHA